MAHQAPCEDLPRNPYRWFVFSIISTVYFFVYFHRVAPSVIVPDLVEDFGADATALGLMASMYFYPYAFEQPIVGYLSDKLGPRRVVGLWSLGATAGCALFALAPSLGWAAAGRALIGLGVGGVFIPAMKAFSQWFPRKEFSGVLGLFLAIGNLGALFATTPLAWMAQQMGWRITFLMLGAITFTLAITILAKVKDQPECLQMEETRENGSEAELGQMRKVVCSSRFWILFWLFFGVFGAYGTLQSLWATPFIMSRLGLERLQASIINMLLPIGLIVGAPLLGRLADRMARNRVELLLAVASAQCLIWIILALGLGSGIIFISSLFLCLGVAAGGLATSFWGVVRAATPTRYLGITTGLLNPAPFLGSALMQVLTGAILDCVGKERGLYPPHGYELAFWACAAGACIPTFAVSILRRKLYPRPDSPPRPNSQ